MNNFDINYNDVMTSLSDDFEAVFVVDAQNDRVMQIRASADYEESVVRDVMIETYSARILAGVEANVIPEDKQRVRDEFKAENVVEKLRLYPSYLLIYQVNTPFGTNLYQRAKFARYKPSVCIENGCDSCWSKERCENCFVLGIKSVDDEMRKTNERERKREREIENNSISMMKELSEDFEYIGSVNLTTKELRSNYISDDFRNVIALISQPGYRNLRLEAEYLATDSIDYSMLDNVEKFDRFIREIMLPEDFTVFIKEIRHYHKNRHRLTAGKKFWYDFRSQKDGGVHYYRLKVVINEKNAEEMLVGIININDIKKSEEMIRQKEEKLRNAAIVDVLASDYSALFIVNLDRNYFVPYNINSGIEESMEINLRSGITFSEAMLGYISAYVYEEDRRTVFAATEIKSIKEQLHNKKSFSLIFRSILNTEPKFCEMKIIKVNSEKDEATSVAIAFAERDSEIISRFVDMKLADEYDSIFLCNLINETYRKIIPSKTFTEDNKGSGRLSELLAQVTEKISPLDAEACKPLQSAYDLGCFMAEYERRELIYRIPGLGNPWRRCLIQTLERKNGKAATVILSFIGIDNRRAENLELNARIAAQKQLLEQDMAVISALSNEYGTISYIDIESSRELQYRSDPVFETIVPEWSEITSFDEHLNLLVNKLIYEEDREVFLEYTRRELILERLREGGSYGVNFRINLFGKLSYYQMTFALDPNNEKHVIVGIRNVDEQKKRDLEAKDKAEAANKAKTAFLLHMSHDIRTPMNAILGFSNMAKRHIDDKECVTDCLDKVELSGHHLLSLINDVLDMSRIESGKLKIEEEAIDLCEEVNELITIVRENAKEKNINVILDTSSVKEKGVLADKLHVNQILLNVLSNAVKYNRENGEVRMTIYDEEVNSKVNKYCFIIEDNGIGMSEELQAHVFESFVRGESADVNSIQGTGIGMAIVRQLVDEMKGTIDIQSEVNKGTTVKIIFEFKKVGIDTATGPAEDSCEEMAIAGHRILVVEDNELNREIINEILNCAGLKIEEACDGAEAVEKIAAHPADYYDWVLMDIQMPRMNGYEATEAVRRLEGYEKNPVILALSANAFDEDRLKAISVGMQDHLVKPVDIELLMKKLKYYLKYR